MSGFLDTKERIIDFHVTALGRDRIANQIFNPAFASITDNSAIYSDKVTEYENLPNHEAYAIYQDEIFLKTLYNNEVHNSGYIYQIVGGYIVNSENEIVDIDEVLLYNYNSFLSHNFLWTLDNLDEDANKFNVNQNQFSFDIDNNTSSILSFDETANINHIESIFQDYRLSQVDNFLYLPPINTKSELPLGVYPSINQSKVYEFEDIKADLNLLEKNNLMQPIYFTQTSQNNNIVGQVIEIQNNSSVRVLDLIDLGEFIDNNMAKRVIYVGNMQQDDNQNYTFINLFTLVFEQQ